MGILRKTIYGLTFGGVGYGYYLSRRYESIPFYKLPQNMEINHIVNTRSKADTDYFFAYCNTFGARVRLDRAKVAKFLSQKELTDSVLVDFVNNSVNQLFFGRQVQLLDLEGTELGYTKIARTKPSSLVVELQIPETLQKCVEFMADWGFPWRVNSYSYQEVYIELTPEVDLDGTIQTYDADILLSCADEYAKHDYDGKILPKMVLGINRFFSRLILDIGARNVGKGLGVTE